MTPILYRVRLETQKPGQLHWTIQGVTVSAVDPETAGAVARDHFAKHGFDTGARISTMPVEFK